MIKDVVVNITKESSSLSADGFGVPLILATNTTADYKEYTSLSAVAADYNSTTAAYKMANAIFSQSPHPAKIAIVGVAYTPTLMVRASLTTSLTGDNNDLTFTSKVTGLAGTYIRVKLTNPAAPTASTTAAVTGTGTSGDPYVIDVTLSYAGSAITATADDVAAAIVASTAANALVKVANATANDGTGVVTALTATALSGGINGSSAAPLTTALNALVQNHNDWYWLLCDVHNHNEILALSAWAATQTKFYVAVTKDDNMIDFEAITSENCALIYHDLDTTYPDAALVGLGSSTTPGSITYKFKTLQGIAAASVTDSRVLELISHNVNTYVSKFGVLQTSEGLCASGEYVDVVVGAAWVNTQMVQQVNETLLKQQKVPYDSKGIGLVLSSVLNVLRQATANGIIAKDDNGQGIYTATAPKRSAVSSGDLTARRLTGVTFTYQIAGAIHSTTINGVISL